MRHLLLASIFAALATGCMGGIGPADDDGDDTSMLAQGMFENDVYPIISAKCGAGCHLSGASTSTAFVATTVAQSYATITGYNSVVGNFTETGAPIFTKIVPGPHNAQQFTTLEQTSIKGWLAQEVIERALPPDPTDPPPTETPGQATTRIINEWSGCLLEADFVELQFGEVWANKSSNEGNCEQCHSSGAAGMWANDDNVLAYQVVAMNKFYMLMFFQPNVLNLADAHMQPNMPPFYRVGGNEAPFTEHPSFNPDDPTAGIGESPLARLQQLYDRTMARKLAGPVPPPAGCGPSVLVP